jgi:hypothetical protein
MPLDGQALGCKCLALRHVSYGETVAYWTANV